MVCEAATSGVPTGVFQLPAKRRSRVALGLAAMQDQHLVATWDDHYKVMTASPGSRILFWQADAAAHWVMKHFLPTGLQR
jgi:hypothetical protein